MKLYITFFHAWITACSLSEMTAVYVSSNRAVSFLVAKTQVADVIGIIQIQVHVRPYNFCHNFVSVFPT